MNFGEVGRSVGNRVLETVGRAASRVQESRGLSTDVLESDDAYLVVFDAPGATQTDVQVRYADDAIEVRIDRFREFYDDYDMRIPGRGMSLDGRAELPADALVDPESANATLRANGTLEVVVPKREPTESDASAGTVEISTPDDDEGDDEQADGDAADEHEDAVEFSDEDEDVHVGDDTDPLESGTGEDPGDFDVEDADDADDVDDER
ncbi:Hsp20 family protein [Halorubellus sp. JP-L1]|uniref:Hsp20/alpha crystallin family protein n=1 Tax=Halorubellus sp. JP-L1 TaxID=2715753 RepID=UPI00140B84AD|nr:Hsp20/alpha crystallin family protein [Halorubellus sp. JP-L1]NHN42564.1 Hsp20 family protein [Halorubellus sp. JP-L1]